MGGETWQSALRESEKSLHVGFVFFSLFTVEVLVELEKSEEFFGDFLERVGDDFRDRGVIPGGAQHVAHGGAHD